MKKLNKEYQRGFIDGAESTAIQAKEIMAYKIEKIKKMKQKTCDCENSELGYHTKNCNMMPYGYNQAIKDILKILK